MPTIRAFPELQSQKKGLAELLDALNDTELELDLESKLERTETLEVLHAQYLAHTAALARNKSELMFFELEMRHACGTRLGIEGMCQYKREIRLEFAEDAFKEEHPELYDQAISASPPKRRIKILPSRDYA